MDFRPIFIQQNHRKIKRKNKIIQIIQNYRTVLVNRFLILLHVVLLLTTQVVAQDSLRTLSAEQVLQIVRKYHPVIIQSDIQIEQANASLNKARGAFDPIISAYIARKTFDGKEYYNTIQPEIEIPAWYGVEFFAGASQWNGNKLDESVTPGQSNYAGVSIPLAKDLIMDKRRAALRQAQIMKKMSYTEQKAIVNSVLMDAMYAYWNWVKAKQILEIIDTNLQVNSVRFQLIRNAYLNGERAAIDTTEAMSLLQSFETMRSNYMMEYQNATLTLSAFMWNADLTPYTLTDNVTPSTSWNNTDVFKNFSVSLDDLTYVARENHPELNIYDFKLKSLQVEKRLKFQELLPKLDFRYNQLGKGFNVFSTLGDGPIFDNSFQYSLKFSMPLSFTAGRADYKLARLKIETTQIDRAQKQNQVLIKIKQSFNEYMALKEQIAIQEAACVNYNKLVEAERIRIENGESTLFVLNARESKALEAQEKLISLQTKYYIALYKMQWSAGILQ